MYKRKLSSQLKKDYKRMERRGKDMQKLEDVFQILGSGEKLDPSYKDHPLKGDYKNHRDCHMEDDWVLIYRIEGDTIYFYRTGTHQDIFPK